MINGQQSSGLDLRLAPQKTIGRANAIFSHPKGRAQIAVQTNPLTLAGNSENGLFLSPNFIVFGRKVVTPPSIEFEFISYSPQRKFLVNRTLQILSHDRALYSDRLVLATWGTSPDATVTEVLVAKIPNKNFTNLIGEKSLSLVVGEARLELTEDNLEALRDLKRMIDSSVSF